MNQLKPDRTSRCTWTPNAENSPHRNKTEFPDRSKVLPHILDAIGQTPMVKLNNIPKCYGVKCEMYAKCEFLNPGGSVKDRIGYRMVEDAEEEGRLKPGTTIIEATSGNTGIGLAMACAVKGYRCVIVMPEKMSNEKVYTLRALGAEIVRTPTEASWDSPDSHVSVSKKLQKEIPNSVILDQYTNASNALVHYDHTATEIHNQCCGKVDYIVAGVGTGGTIAGIGRKFKEISPETKIIGADPRGSILALPEKLNETDVKTYEVEGIGYDFVPTVLDRCVVDEWVKTEDCESFHAARMLIREEGLLCGGSSGSALCAAVKIAKDLPEDKRVVVLLPDGIRNYMTKFASDHWMEARGFLEPPAPIQENKWWWNKSVSDLNVGKSIVIKENTTNCQEALQMFEETKCQQFLISNDDVHVKGVINPDLLMTNLISGAVKYTDCVEKSMSKTFVKVKPSTTLGLVSRILEKDPYVVVLDDLNDNAIVGVVNHSHILKFTAKKTVNAS